MRKENVFLTAAGRLFGGGEGTPRSPGTGIENFAFPACDPVPPWSQAPCPVSMGSR